MSSSSRRALRVALATCLGLAPGAATAQGPIDPSGPMPAGHPPLGGRPSPSAHGGSAGGEPGGEAPQGSPRAEPREDRSEKALDLRPGTLEVRVRDAFAQPVAGARVELGVLFQDPAEGESKNQLVGTTNAEGIALFSGLTVDSNHSYRAVVAQGAASFASDSIRLDVLGGHRVLLHVYPSTPDINRALVGMRGTVYVQPRDDVFQIEANFQVFNIGAVAWVPGGLALPLPEGAKAVRAQESMHDARVEKTSEGGLALTGTFGPGQRELSYQFQLDNSHEASRTFRLALPPHVAEMRVLAEGPRSMTLAVDGFSPAEAGRGQDGARLLVTGRRMTQGDEALGQIHLTLTGLPVPSAGRWYAAGIAALLASAGLSSLLRRAGRGGPSASNATEAREAEDLVLDELVLLEELHREGRIGPRTYEASRAELLDALARLSLRQSHGDPA